MAKVGYGYRKGFNPILGDVELERKHDSDYIEIRTEDYNVSVPLCFSVQGSKVRINPDATEESIETAIKRMIKAKKRYV